MHDAGLHRNIDALPAFWYIALPCLQPRVGYEVHVPLWGVRLRLREPMDLRFCNNPAHLTERAGPVGRRLPSWTRKKDFGLVGLCQSPVALVSAALGGAVFAGSLLCSQKVQAKLACVSCAAGLAILAAAALLWTKVFGFVPPTHSFQPPQQPTSQHIHNRQSLTILGEENPGAADRSWLLCYTTPPT